MNQDAQTTRNRDQEELNTRQRAVILGLQYADVRDILPSFKPVEGLLSKEQLYNGKLAPLQPVNNEQPLVVGITVGTPQSLLRQLRDTYIRDNIQFVMISNSGWRELMQVYDPPKTVVYDNVKIAEEGDSATIKSVSETLAGVKPDDILTYLIEQADGLKASDIHIENQSDDVRIRMRIDGALHAVATVDHDKYRSLQAAIASKADISTASEKAQTGHMRHTYQASDGPRDINMRIETVPTIYGQDAVIRLFTYDKSLLNLDHLGLNEANRKQIDSIIKHPHGMVMVVGPTGAGKSTTLYSIISALNQTTRKIITLEDPVEFSIPGISQIPVNTNDGDSFAEKLRAVMRLDPDVVMVGEIRDTDTAKTAIQASVTGHLVLTTFHADNAAAALSRMIDMIGQNPIFISAIRLVIGQRLVRRLDDATKQAYQPDKKEVEWIRSIVETFPEGAEKPDLNNLTLYKAGKSDENPFGYAGRIPLIEQMAIENNIQELLKTANAYDAASLQKAAISDGMITLMQDGIKKVIAGETTIEEINRVL